MTTKKTDHASAGSSSDGAPAKAGPVPIVALGASAGGLEAFEAFFRHMPIDSGLAFVLVSHLDPHHVSLLPELLQRVTSMPVAAVKDGEPVLPNRVYVIPPNRELAINAGILYLLNLPANRAGHLPINQFFSSLAGAQGNRSCVIVLSGTGTDGVLGIKAMKSAGGRCMVQDPQSAKYDGMPLSAVATGLVDDVLAVEQMPMRLLLDFAAPLRVLYQGHHEQEPAAEAEDNSDLQKIFILLRRKVGHDFSQYKRSTISRRIERRMLAHQLVNLAGYVDFLLSHPSEIDLLFQELLIGVTHFFRDSEVFDGLKSQLVLALQNKSDGDTFRVWVPGCSTGEEAYSLCILLLECMDEMKMRLELQVFATDVDEAAVQTARTGYYPDSIRRDVSKIRLRRFFTRKGAHDNTPDNIYGNAYDNVYDNVYDNAYEKNSDNVLSQSGGYQVKKIVRESVVFALQNVLSDAPFTRIDLVSCRNLMIYLNRSLQSKLLRLFHYSLKPNGILLLGSSETVGEASDLFKRQGDMGWKIYRRESSPDSSRFYADFPMPEILTAAMTVSPKHVVDPQVDSDPITLSVVEAMLLESDLPPCMIIDKYFQLLYVHGRVSQFLEFSQGRSTFNVLEILKPAFKSAISRLVDDVNNDRIEATIRELKVPSEQGDLLFDLSAKVIGTLAAKGRLIMVMFRQRVPEVQGMSGDKAKSIESLEWELQNVKANLRNTIEALEISNESLKSANEELQSTNEELQSTNEEMETSKEELQSLNEESVTVNAELQSHLEELSNAHDDMQNLLDSTDIAMIFLDVDLGIRRSTPSITRIVPITMSDVGRPIADFATNLLRVDIASQAAEVLVSLSGREVEVSDKINRVYMMRIRPYRTTLNVIDGVVVTFFEITLLKQAEHIIKNAREDRDKLVDERTSKLRGKIVDLQSVLDLVPTLVLRVDDGRGEITLTSASVRQVLGYTESELVAMKYSDIDVESLGKQRGALLQGWNKAESLVFNTKYRHKSGALLAVTTTVNVLINGVTDSADEQLIYISTVVGG
jgi:two-component system CheB/CheR fusion protein